MAVKKYCSGSFFLKLFALIWLSMSAPSLLCAEAVIEGLKVRLGDSLEQVRDEFSTLRKLESTNYKYPYGLTFEDKGIVLFFDESKTVWQISLLPPFGGSVANISLGDQENKILEKLSALQLHAEKQSRTNGAEYLVAKDGVTIEFYVSADGMVESMYLARGDEVLDQASSPNSFPKPPAATESELLQCEEYARKRAVTPDVTEKKYYMNKIRKLCPGIKFTCLSFSGQLEKTRCKSRAWDGY